MLRRALIAVSIAILTLALIDWASSFLVPCQEIAATPGQEEHHRNLTKENCAVSGVVSQGAALIWGAVTEWKAEVWTALATIWVALFTLVLAIATYIQAGFTREAINVARDEFTSTHRPRIRIKYLSLKKPKADEPFKIRLAVVNYGETTGTIFRISAALFMLDEGQAFPADFPFVNRRVNCSLEIPSGITIVMPGLADNLVVSQDSVEAINRGTRVLYCVGQVEYTDAAERIRTTGYARILERPYTPGRRGRLLPMDKPDPDYDYQD